MNLLANRLGQNMLGVNIQLFALIYIVLQFIPIFVVPLKTALNFRSNHNTLKFLKVFRIFQSRPCLGQQKINTCTRESEKKSQNQGMCNVRVCEIESEFGRLKDHYPTKMVGVKFYKLERNLQQKFIVLNLRQSSSNQLKFFHNRNFMTPIK